VVTTDGKATRVAVTSIRHWLEQETGPGDDRDGTMEDSDGVMVRSTVAVMVRSTVVEMVVAIVVGTMTVVGCRDVKVTVEKIVETVVTAGL
jgi:hypothetical protein